MRKVKLKTASTALVLGTFVAFMHFVWMLMVYLGVGQAYLDWILGLHLVTNPITVLPFNFGTAAVLLTVTFVVGYLAGWVFAYIWNRLHK